jgi:hypothetical protein
MTNFPKRLFCINKTLPDRPVHKDPSSDEGHHGKLQREGARMMMYGR